MEPRFKEVAEDRPNLFVKSRVRYIENLVITNFRGNDQTVPYFEVIVNDWFVTQVTSVTQFNAIHKVRERTHDLNRSKQDSDKQTRVALDLKVSLIACPFFKTKTLPTFPLFDINSLYRGRFYVWAPGLCSLYRGISYIEVRYIEVLFHTFFCNFGRDSR